MKNHPPLQNGCFYHIYGSGVDKCEVFRESEDFERFIIDYQRYIDTIAETYAWCLMPNHFHFLLRIKEESEIKFLSEHDLTEIFKTSDKTTKSNSHIRVTKTPSTASKEKDVFKPPLAENSAGLTVEPPPGSTGGVERIDWMTRKPKPSHQFSHLLNSYAQYFNHKYKRQGALLEKGFKRKKVDNTSYFRNLVIYIHQNPVHHGFVSHPMEYPWSSYLSCISIKPTRIQRDAVIGWFDDVGKFKELHLKKANPYLIEKWLGFNA